MTVAHSPVRFFMSTTQMYDFARYSNLAGLARVASAKTVH
jgi:hypothetical protein